MLTLFYVFILPYPSCSFFFFLNDPATPEISPFPLHAALPIWWENFVDPAMESILSAVLVFMDVSPHASASRFKFLEPHREPSWSKPLSVELRVCVCFEDELAGCVKLPCDEELLLARFSSNFCLTHFFSPPFASSFFSASNSLSKAS